MEMTYVLCPVVWTLQDAPNKQRREQLAFHVRSGDYFGTLASILRLLEEQIGYRHESRQEILKRLHEDLDYLQSHYHITQKKNHTSPDL